MRISADYNLANYTKRTARLTIVLMNVALASTSFSAAELTSDSLSPEAAAFFEKEVRPLLVERCYDCHGPDTDEGEGGLRLDSLLGLLRGGESGPAIIRENPSQSLLLLAVNHDSTVAAMPPEDKLPLAEIKTLTQWVKRGAFWPNSGDVESKLKKHSTSNEQALAAGRRFWAFQRPELPDIPAVKNASWPRNTVDRFILNRLEGEGLVPAEHADRRTLIRRATFDLHGLPPSPQEVRDFLSDTSSTAFADLVERLLESPRYGEHWGRHWLDVARYADSNGMDDNIAYADAWRYRDYVIAAFNKDKPYVEFVREQIAGDLLDHRDNDHRQEAVIATGFLMVGPKMPSTDDPIKQQLDIVDEQLDTTSVAFMGLTMGCVRCHDHKFDPLYASDYYALAGIFKSTRTMVSYRVDSKYNLVDLEGAYQNAALTELETSLDLHDDALVNGNALAMSDEQRAAHAKGVEQTLKAMSLRPTAMAVEDDQPADMNILLRGNHLTPGAVVSRRTPLVLPVDEFRQVADGASGRRELAFWMTNPNHPLTARVMINRIWHWHFGRGIVASVDNFGKLGERPDNPALLDWLATRFVKSGWSIKAMHRLLMKSGTYQMSSVPSKSTSDTDPENRWLSHQRRRRMTAEMLRDSLLMVSGQLDFATGGSLLPSANHQNMLQADVAKANATFSTPRRTVYLPVIRSGLNGLLSTFDFPDPSTSTGQRQATTVAPQALMLMNSDLMKSTCEQLAHQYQQESAVTDAIRLETAYQLVQCRSASAEEVDRWRVFLGSYQQAERINGSSPEMASRRAWEAVFRVLLSSSAFVYID